MEEEDRLGQRQRQRLGLMLRLGLGLGPGLEQVLKTGHSLPPSPTHPSPNSIWLQPLLPLRSTNSHLETVVQRPCCGHLTLCFLSERGPRGHWLQIKHVLP